jgi:Dolichyl-phosphate-mannose-protein mannosyltransferase
MRGGDLSSFAINGGSKVNAVSRRPQWAILLTIASAVALLHILTNGRYGFHRDELQFLSDARHLDWGFVAYPPLTPFLERIGLALFGVSLVGLRLFSVIFQASAIVLTGLMAKELGGGRLAQVTAALAVALSPLPMFNGTEFQYTSFDFLWWMLVAYFTIRLLRTENPRWWLAIGAAIGMGLETKYTICFLIAGLLVGLLTSSARHWCTSKWFWAGVAVALLIFLPNLIWQFRHDFITYHFLQFIHARDVRQGRGEQFWLKQFFVCANLWSAPLWIGGVWMYMRCARYRPLALMFLIPAAYFTVAHAVFYYLAPAYPMAIAMGAAGMERLTNRMPSGWAIAAPTVLVLGMLSAGAYGVAIVVPLANSGPLKEFALKTNDALREEIGWDQMVKTVAGIRDSLPPDQQAHLGITTGNYGEYGAIEILGSAYGLPKPIGITNSEWLRGYPTPPPTTIIVLGLGREQADSTFTGCRLAGRNVNSEGIRNEESQYHPDIFVCGPPRLPWAELWKYHQDFG